jgi:hypothetical protein
MDFGVRLQGLVDLIAATGVNVGIDARDVNPPGVLVAGAAVTDNVKLCGADQLRASVILFARDTGDAAAYSDLSDLKAKVDPVVGPIRTTDEAPFEWRSLPDNPTALPTLRLTVAIIEGGRP